MSKTPISHDDIENGLKKTLKLVKKLRKDFTPPAVVGMLVGVASILGFTFYETPEEVKEVLDQVFDATLRDEARRKKSENSAKGA